MGKKRSKLNPAATQMAELLVEELAGLGDVSSRKMFGGYGVFESGKMFAMVDSNGVAHLKVDDSNRERFEMAGSAQHGCMPYYEVPTKVLENTRSLRRWASVSISLANQQ